MNTQPHIQVSISVIQQELNDILIARLSAEGYDGFEEETGVLKAFIPQISFDETVLKKILNEYELNFSSTVLPVTNWNEEWEKNFQPVIVDDFCAIRAGFHQPVGDVQFEIVITPKMSFGTGHHATTYMMVQLMRTVDFYRKYVFDFGTGTGILSILADKLGAEEVVAIDNDDWSITNATENLAANKCEHVLLLKSGNIPEAKSFDIILANINKHVIAGTLKQMISKLNSNGILLLSGLLETDFDEIHRVAVANNLRLQQQLSGSGWIAFKYQLI
ncbi:MAG TPA: 50S ribosomal protein L11 methyltransferase [Chitinophagaceae bacterium]